MDEAVMSVREVTDGGNITHQQDNDSTAVATVSTSLFLNCSSNSIFLISRVMRIMN